MPSRPAIRRALLLATTLLLFAVPTRGALPDHPALSVEPLPAWAVIEEFLEEPSVTVAEGKELEGSSAAPEPADGESDPEAAGAENESAAADEEVRSVRFLLTDVQTWLPNRGPGQRFERSAYRIETRSALENWSSWQIEFSPDHQQLVLHHVRIGRDGRWLDRLQRSQASLLQREAGLESHTYDESRTLALVLDDVRVGDVVDIAWSLRGANPIFDGAFFGSFGLHGYRTSDLLRVSIDHPRSRALDYRLFGGAPEPAVARLGHRTRWTWEVREPPDIERESWVPAGVSQTPWLQVSEYPSWSDVVAWATPYYGLSDAVEDEAAIAAALAELEDSSADDPRRRLAAVREFVQDDVRYFAHLMGPHSHAPHAPGDILRRRYGDCKDKTFLMVHLLEALGIEAWPVFVHTSQGLALRDRLPSPGLFDHAIVGTALPDGPIYIDPTMRLQGGVEEMWTPDYGWGLEVREGSRDLARIASQPGAAGVTEVTYRYDVPAAGLVSDVTIETVHRGGRADRERDSWNGSDPSETLESFVSFYTNEVHRPTSKAPLQFEDDRHGNVLRFVERYDLEYVPDEESPITFETLPLLFPDLLPNVPWEEPSEEDAEDERDGEVQVAVQTEAASAGSADDPSTARRFPIRLPHPTHMIETVQLRTEDETDWDFEEVSIERPWLRFEVRHSLSGDTMEVRYELQTLADQVPAESIADYRLVYDEIHQHTGVNIWDQLTGAVDPETRTRALAMLTLSLSFLTVLAFGSVIVQRRRGIL